MTIIRNPENRELYHLGLKHCYKCDEIKPLSEFNKKKNTWDGLRSNCRDCDRNQHITYRSNPEKNRKEIEYKRQYRQSEHGQAVTVRYGRKWDKENRDRKKWLKTRWHLAHKEQENAKARERMKQWVKENPDKHRTNGRKYRARSVQAEGSHTLEQWQTLLSFFNGYCPSCGKKAKLTLDHIIPLNKGGAHYIDNCQALCKRCNSAKMDILIIDYRPSPIRRWAYLETNGLIGILA